ncbi:MAG: polysaccharide deacetylase family protein [Hyphomonadaceae bacterium]
MSAANGPSRFMRCALIFAAGLLLIVSPLSAPLLPPAHAEADCAADAIGVSRTITLSVGDPALHSLLHDHEVVLTFDDGPAETTTRKVLAALREQCVAATFFLEGENVLQHPDIVRDIALAGHSLGGHSQHHKPYVNMTPNAARSDVERSIASINKALAGSPATSGIKVGLFRFPFVASTKKLEKMVADLGLVSIPVDADGHDWEIQSPESVVDHVFTMLANTNNRGIVLLHDPFESAPEATSLLLKRLRAGGYRIVAIRAKGE